MVPTLLEILLHFVWPVQCPLCGRIASVVCPDCLDALLGETMNLCSLCRGSYPCSSHGGAPPLFVGALHEGRPRELLLLLKYKGMRSLGPPLGRALGRAFEAPAADALVPLPLHRGSPRGYNQSLLIARGLSTIWRLPVVDGLAWTGRRPGQTGRSAAQRLDLPEDVLRWKAGTASVAGRRLVVVDDVCTTGATLDRARRVLEGAGASVAALVVWTASEGGRGAP